MMIKKILSLFLACLMVLPLAACAGGDKKPAADTTTAAPASTDPAETTDDFYADRNNAKDSLPDKLDFGDADVRILSHKIDAWGKSNVPEIEFFNDGENATNIVTTAVVKRNRVVEDRLGICMVIINDGDEYDNKDRVRTSIMSFSDDYDIYVSGNGYIRECIEEGFLTDMSTLDYLDTSKPWWNASYVEALTIDDRLFSVTGELAISLLSNNFITYFNKSLWNDYHGDEDLYQIVRDGNFTLDKFAELCSNVYKDLNGDGAADRDDQYGNIHPWETLSSDCFAAGSKIHYYDYDEDAEHYYYSFGSSDKDLAFIEKLRTIWFKNNNTYTSANNEMDDDDDQMKKIKNDTALFTVAKMGNVEYLRDMDSDFGIVPVPKYDEEQEGYFTMPVLKFSAFGILTSSPEPDMIAAFLEAACAENYRYVTPAYFDSAVKYGYTRDEDSAEMLDVCVAGVYLPFECALSLGGVNLISTHCNTEKSMDRLASIIAKMAPGWEKETNERMEALRSIF